MSSRPPSEPPTQRQPPERVRATFDGEPIDAEAGASVAAAIMSTHGSAWRTTKSGTQRGIFCGIGVCYDCIVEINGESGQRSCMIPLTDGMDVRPADGTRADADAVATRSSRHTTPNQPDMPDAPAHERIAETSWEDDA